MNQKKYLVCIDSDGCAIDSMNIKHIRCFGPAFITIWQLEQRRDELLNRWNEINLYSATRGINRFKGLAIMLQEFDTMDSKENIDAFIQWTNTAPELSNSTLQTICDGSSGNAVFLKALNWSFMVNSLIEKLPVPTPFNHVKSCLKEISNQADIAVVSSANREAIAMEWGQSSLINYVNHLFSQSDGSKYQCIKKLIEQGYDQDHILMIGDAPGDYIAAKDNQVWFYPILANQEDQSWHLLQTKYLELFFAYKFDSSLQQELIIEMEKNLTSSNAV